jgi:DNA-binding NarL/FixJ family response regulator
VSGSPLLYPPSLVQRAVGALFLRVIATPSMIRISLSSGGSAYAVKDDAADELVPAIEAAREGRDYVSSTGRPALSWI